MNNPRRYLLCKSNYDVSILFLDDHGSCHHYDYEGNLYPTRYHPYRDAKGLLQTLLCPNSLSQDEWTRTFVDDPPGSWMAQYAAYREGPPKRSQVEES